MFIYKLQMTQNEPEVEFRNNNNGSQRKFDLK